jgi:hypothetical protein
MESSTTIEYDDIKVVISRGDEKSDDNVISLVFEELDKLEVNLSDSGVDDIKKLFDVVFDYIVNKRKLITFTLDDSDNDLYTQISQDIIDQLNSEIKESESNFQKIWELAPDNKEASSEVGQSEL